MMKTILFLSTVLIFAKTSRQVDVYTENMDCNDKLSQYDTSETRVTGFKDFSRKFFQAANNNDTGFIKQHVVFPISNSSFSDIDTTLEPRAQISKKYFLKNISLLFPKVIINRIGKEGKFMNSNRNKKEFIIVLYNYGTIESNYTWVFILQKNVFYFTQFLAEAG